MKRIEEGLTLRGKRLQNVGSFKYLGSSTNTNDNCLADIRTTTMFGKQEYKHRNENEIIQRTQISDSKAGMVAKRGLVRKLKKKTISVPQPDGHDCAKSASETTQMARTYS